MRKKHKVSYTTITDLTYTVCEQFTCCKNLGILSNIFKAQSPCL